MDTDMGALDDESRRAWTEPMAVRPFGDDYLVDCEGAGTQFVSLADRTCSCRRSREESQCKHVRRVAIEINLGRVPAPAESAVECECCGDDVERPGSDPPQLCAECRVDVGDVVVDVEGNPTTPLLVVSRPRYRADRVAVPDEGCTVATYPGNGTYDPADPVVEVVYPQRISADRSPKRYRFPVSRLASPPDAETHQATLAEVLPQWTGK